MRTIGMKALIWKELREYRMFIVAAVMILIFFKIVCVIFWKIYPVHPDYGMYFSVTGWALLPLLFSFIGSMTFTSEFQQNTKAFLLTKPFNTSKIFIGKYISGLILLIILSIISFLLAGDIAGTGNKNIFWDYGPITTYPVLLPVLTYNLIILASLMVRQSLPSIFLAPLLLIPETVIICPFMICIYYYCSLELVLPLIALLFIVLNVALSYLAWQKAVAKDIKPWKILAKTCAVVFVLAWTFHVMISIQSQLQVNYAKAKAEKAGFDFNIINKMCENVPDEQNSAVVYREARRKLESIKTKFKTNDVIKKSEEHKDWTDWDYICSYHYKCETVKLTDDQMARIRKVLIDDEDIVKLWSLIKKGSDLEYYRLGVKSNDYNAFTEHWVDLRWIMSLIESRTAALAEEGRVEEALASADVEFKIMHSYAQLTAYFYPTHYAISSYSYDKIIKSLLNVPLDPAMLPYLRKLMLQSEGFKRIDFTEQIFIDSVPMVYVHYYENMMVRSNPKDDSYDSGFDPKSAVLYTNFIMSPYLKKDTASFLLKSTMIMEDLKTNKPLPRIQYPRDFLNGKIFMNNYFSYALYDYLYEFEYRDATKAVVSDMFKLSIALKIFKIQHGKYPEKFEQLVPDIIPKLPAYTGDKGKLQYKIIGNGFSISTGNQKSYRLGYNKEIYMDR
ncbi:MAG TPA: hypothetical protein DCZ94_20005 [Lentisphaeria bacterium]|nr:MAG: hypothetical protein A2X48_09795 [Lentisphaerae bacterium GWF2_49_21]HBC89231.1 hypothetical protein [Lentisphaeria bacterium]